MNNRSRTIWSNSTGSPPCRRPEGIAMISSEDLVGACVSSKKSEAREPDVQAWAYFDADHALARRSRRHAWRAAGNQLGPLHGVPVGLKERVSIPATCQPRTERPCTPGAVPGTMRRLSNCCAGRRVRHRQKRPRTEMATLHTGETQKPTQSCTYAGWFIEWIRRCSSRRHGAAGAGHADQRLAAPACCLLRGIRLQANSRPDRQGVLRSCKALSRFAQALRAQR